MKKSTLVLIIALTFLIVLMCIIFSVDHIRMNNNQPVLFSTWGKKYAPSEEITPDEAIEKVKNVLDDKSRETITNLDNPKIEEVVFDSERHMLYFDDNEKPSYEPLYKIKGKTLYKITFNTTQDGLLGPLVFYVNKSDGKLIGVDYRM